MPSPVEMNSRPLLTPLATSLSSYMLQSSSLKGPKKTVSDDGADPSTISKGNYFTQEGILFKNTAPDDEEGGNESIMVVPTSLSEAENIIRALHNDLGHLAELVERTLRTCKLCQFTRREPSIPQTHRPLPRVNLGDIWAFDFVGPFTHGKALPRRSGESVISLLQLLISLVVQNFLQRMKIHHLHTSPYHPQINGRLEKFNDT